MADPGPATGGLFATVRQVLASTLKTVKDRVELMSAEFQQEKAHLVQLLILGVVTGVLTVLALVGITASVILSLESEVARFNAVKIFTGIYLVLAVILGLVIRARVKRKPFAGTIAEFEKDRKKIGLGK